METAYEINLNEIRGRYYQREKVHFCEFAQLPEAWSLIYQVTEPEESSVLCPKNLTTDCEGVIIFRDSKHPGWEPCLGCSSSECNFYITRVKFLAKSVLHPQCPRCQCTPTEFPKRPLTVQELTEEYIRESGGNLSSEQLADFDFPRASKDDLKFNRNE